MMVGDIYYSSIPKQPLQLKGLFFLNSFQGIGWLRVLYVFGWLWALLLMVVAIIFSLASGDLFNILSSVILGPIFFLLTVILLRVVIEVLVSILLLPHVASRKPSPSRCELQQFDSQGSDASVV